MLYDRLGRSSEGRDWVPVPDCRPPAPVARGGRHSRWRRTAGGPGLRRPQVAAYSIGASGALKALAGSPFNVTPTKAGLADMAVSPVGRSLYTVGGSQLGGVAIAASGRLTKLPGSPYAYPAGSSAAPQALAIGPGGSEVFASDPASSTVASFRVKDNGSLEAIGAPLSTGSTAPDQYGVAVTPDQSPTGVVLGQGREERKADDVRRQRLDGVKRRARAVRVEIW